MSEWTASLGPGSEQEGGLRTEGPGTETQPQRVRKAFTHSVVSCVWFIGGSGEGDRAPTRQGGSLHKGLSEPRQEEESVHREEESAGGRGRMNCKPEHQPTEQTG